MATTSKYFVLTPSADNLDFVDFNLHYGSITTAGESIQYNGSSRVDSVFARPGLTYDLSNTAGGTDKIYLTGNLSDYALSFNSVAQTLNLSRNLGTPNQESITVAGGTSLNFDNLIFANGTVNANALAVAVRTSAPLPIPNASETSLAPTGAAAPGAVLNATVQAFSTNSAGINQVGETFATVKPGISYVVKGGNGIDTVYVADGETVDATVLGASVDLVYFRGKWADYTKSTLSSGTKLLFTRTIDGHQESVTVTAGTAFNHDMLIFADGAVTSDNALVGISTNPSIPLVDVTGVDPTTVTPLYSDEEVAAAIATISAAAQANNAGDATTPLSVYITAGVTGVTPANLAAINDALNSLPINGALTDTKPEIQAVIDAYNAILASADGVANNTATPLTGAQYANVGVTGVAGFAAPGNAMALLNSAVDAKPSSGVDTVPELQALADAASHVIAAAGGTPAQVAALTLPDLTALGITGVTPDNLPAVLAAIASTVPDTAIDSVGELQAVVDSAATSAANALAVISAAAQNNTALSSGLDIPVFTAAGVSGVTLANRASIDSALDSAAVNGAAADTTAEVQGIVNAYKAILASADGIGNNTATPLTNLQYSAIGVTGVSGFAAPGNALFLLNSVVDGKPTTAVDTEPEVQALADAANHVIAAAGGTPAQVGALTLADLTALGITGVTPDTLPSVLQAIGATVPDTAVDTQGELQAIANAAVASAVNALNAIRDAAQNNTAISTGLDIPVYTAAGVSGVTSANLISIDLALDSAAVTGAQADTTAKVQGIVNAYNAILASADGTAGNTSPSLSGAQYSAIGVTGVAGIAAPGNTMNLLDSAVDASLSAGVDTVVEVQAMADAANHVIAAAGGTPGQIAALTLNDLIALGVTGVTASNLPAVQAAIGAVAADADVDTLPELQAIVNVGATNAANALAIIAAAAQNNNAVSSGLAAAVYAAAGVSGVTAANQASIDSALDSAAIAGAQADTTPEVQTIVDAYKAILASADGVAGNTALPLTGAQYVAIGVTGVSGFAVPATALALLNSAVDALPSTEVDTQAEVQALANAAKHVLDAAGGTPAQIAALTQADLVALGITGVTPANLPTVLAAIGAATDAGVDTQAELQALVNTVGTGAANALNQIRDAAQNNTAVSSGLAAAVYAAAGVSGVTAANQTSIDSALDSAAITGTQADTVPEVQAIVDAYKAILASADGVAGNTSPALSGAQYSAIGVTGVSGLAAPGNALFLLDNVVDGKPVTAVDTQAEVQALADAANHVMDAAGGTPAQVAALTPADLAALGVTGVTPDNLPAVLAAIAATVPDSAIDTLGELQAVVNGAATNAANALNQIRDAAQINTATDTSPAVSVYVAAGVTGVSAADLASVNSALDSAAVTGAQADTTAEVQAIVNAYSAILASADGTPDNTATPLTGTQYTLVGVTGVSGVSAPGNALHLLDSVVDASAVAAVDTVPELQAMADAAAHVITGSAGGTAPTLGDLSALGISGVTAANLDIVQAAIAATTDDGTGVDTKAELQAVVTASINAHPVITNSLAGVTNLDVTSNLVLSSNQSLTVGSGFIHITDLGGAGYQGDTSNNTQTIDVATAVANHLLTITGTGANTRIVINPVWDLDLASNYQLSIDDGAFLNASGTQAAAHIAPINFSTVTPGTHGSGTAASEAVASQSMVDATGALTASKSWLNIEGIGNNTGNVTQLGDLSGGAYALVMKNYATSRGGDPALGGNGSDGIATHDTNVGVLNFGNNDIVYFDSQVNNSAIQFFDARYTGMTDGSTVGGLTGQNVLVMGLVSTPQQQGSTAMILLGLEGNTTNKVYAAIESLPDGTVGWANVWHTASAPVIMG